MDAAQFVELVKKIEVGKKFPDAIYLHESALDAIPVKLATIINAVGKALKIPTDNWNIVKLSRKSFTMSLLHYPTFFPEQHWPHKNIGSRSNLHKFE